MDLEHIITGGWDKLSFSPMKSGAGRKSFRSAIFQFCSPPPLLIINDQSLILINLEGLVLFSPKEITQELYKLVTLISQGIDRYKVPVVAKNGKLNEMIEVSALWSMLMFVGLGLPVRAHAQV